MCEDCNTDSGPVGPEPAWVTSLADQRLALLDETCADLVGFDSVLTGIEPMPNLEGMTDEEINKWERSCSCCHRYVPDHGEFYMGAVHRKLRTGVEVTLIVAVCGQHKY